MSTPGPAVAQTSAWPDDGSAVGALAVSRTETLSARLHGRSIVWMGDSAAYGWQWARFPGHFGFDPDVVFPGAAGVLHDLLARRGIDTRTVNFSCPAETLVSFVAGPCAWHDAGVPLHGGITYVGSAQHQAALAFLRDERDRVGAVSLMLGGNDLFGLVVACAGDLEAPVDPGPCVDANLETFIDTQVRLHVNTVREIRSVVPEAIVLVHLEADILSPQSGLLLDAYYDASRVVEEYNASVSAAVRRAGAFAVDFNRPFTRTRASLCRYTGLCGVDADGQPDPDGHPSDAGYAKIAELDFVTLLRAAGIR